LEGESYPTIKEKDRGHNEKNIQTKGEILVAQNMGTPTCGESPRRGIGSSYDLLRVTEGREGRKGLTVKWRKKKRKAIYCRIANDGQFWIAPIMSYTLHTINTGGRKNTITLENER